MSGGSSEPYSVFARAGLLLVVVALVAGAVLGGYFAARRPEVQLTPAPRDLAVAPFRLVDQLNRPVNESDLQGRVLVVSFIFTSCSVSCLQVSYHMAEIQKAFEGASDVRLLSITVDPREDTPEALQAFGKKFGADARSWLFLTGAATNVHGLLRKSFLSVDQPGTYNPMPGGYVDADRIAVVDRDGRVVGFARGTTPDCVDKVVRSVNALRTGGSNR